MRFTYYSPAIEQLQGYTPEEAMARTIQESLTADSFEKAINVFNEELEEHNKGGRDPSKSIILELEVTCKDGATKMTEVQSNFTYDLNGHPIGVIGVTRDISERKRAEESLRTSHERFLTVLDSIDATIYVADMETYEILFMNKNMKESFGRDMTGEICWDVFRKESEPCRHCTNDQLIDENGKPTGVYVWQDRNPITDKWYINYDRAIDWTDGRLVRLQIATDIDNLKRMEEELRQAHKMESIGTLAGGIAHDFNNVLYSIIGYTELTMDDVPEGSLAQKNLKEVFKGAMRAKDMVQQILAFSRKADTEKKPIKVQSVVKEALKLLRTSIPSTIEIRQNIDADCGPVLADPTQIHQVVMNLATNAYQAMREKGGILELTLMGEDIRSDDSESYLDLDPGNYLKLTVRDTGHGMDNVIIDKIFDPYFSTKNPGEGTGMGLAVVHGIVKDHGGDIEVYSEIGEGTTFTVYLPLVESIPVEPKAISVEPVPMGTERILFVDDEEAIVFMTQQTLERLGYQVIPRVSSVEALEAFRAQPGNFDLVITDLTMPNMTGVELASKLLDIRPDIPIIICTGFSEVIDKNRAKAVGIREYVMKPIVKEEIARTIRKVLDEGQEK